MVIVYQGGDIGIKGASIFTTGQRINGGLSHPGELPLLITLNGFAQHCLQARGLLHVTGFNGVDDIHQHASRGMTQVQAKKQNGNGRKGKAPGHNVGFMTDQGIERRTGDPINNEPVGIRKRVVIIPGVSGFIVNMSLAAGHLLH
ncbi:hypothetical protein DR73_4595 [Enterobacteriaceae bacterium ATCC 29904]|nr:hypothetical protein DR73_4595 [Enterobacteriaceae bacterium ATCC 29904]